MINLKEVVKKYPECLESADKLHAYLYDIYPEEKAKTRVLVDGFRCGIYDALKTLDYIDNLLIEKLSNRFQIHIGYTPEICKWCVNEWIKATGVKKKRKKSAGKKNVVNPNQNSDTYYYTYKNSNNSVIINCSDGNGTVIISEGLTITGKSAGCNFNSVKIRFSDGVITLVTSSEKSD